MKTNISKEKIVQVYKVDFKKRKVISISTFGYNEKTGELIWRKTKVMRKVRKKKAA